jgi:acetyltransferase
MSTYRLKNLLSPRSFALVGASPRQGSVGRAILQNTLKAKFKGEFGLVNPRYAALSLSVPGLGMARGRWRTRPNVSRRNMGCG